MPSLVQRRKKSGDFPRLCGPPSLPDLSCDIWSFVLLNSSFFSLFFCSLALPRSTAISGCQPLSLRFPPSIFVSTFFFCLIVSFSVIDFRDEDSRLHSVSVCPRTQSFSLMYPSVRVASGTLHGASYATSPLVLSLSLLFPSVFVLSLRRGRGELMMLPLDNFRLPFFFLTNPGKTHSKCF